MTSKSSGAARKSAASPTAAVVMCTTSPAAAPTAAKNPARGPLLIPVASANSMSGPGSRMSTVIVTRYAPKSDPFTLSVLPFSLRSKAPSGARQTQSPQSYASIASPGTNSNSQERSGVSAFIITRIQVGDYDAWRPMFDQDRPRAREKANVQRIFRNVDDPNHVFILLEFANREDAQEGQRRLVESGVLDRFEDKHGPNLVEEADPILA